MGRIIPTLPRGYCNYLKCNLVDEFTRFSVWVASQIVEKYGVDYFESSMDAIQQITNLFTGEFAIRPFLIRYPEKTFKVLDQWVNNNSSDVRRLVSEGSRSRLP